MLDFLATEPHFLDHLAPLWRALPSERRGAFYVTEPLAMRAKELEVDAIIAEVPLDEGPVTVVASYGDLKRARQNGRRVVLSEHGAGQSYVGTRSGSYIGAPDRAGVVGVLVPGNNAVARHERVHPTIPAHPIGCPRLDPWHTRPGPANASPVVAISFHWNCTLVQETKSAFRHYERILATLAREFPGAIGHAHPRMMPRIRNRLRSSGLDVVDDFAEVLDRADLYAVDNSSTLYEFASTGRPVVVLNAPWYRRGVSHGMRFWDHADIGLQVNQPRALIATIRQALEHDDRSRAEEILTDVYATTAGDATARGVVALEALADRWGPT